MNLNVRAVAVAVGTTTAIFFVLCSLLYMAAPDAAGWTGRLFHVDIREIFRPVTAIDVIVGAIGWWVLMAVIAGAATLVYNRLARPGG